MFDQLLGSALLLIVILPAVDKYNMNCEASSGLSSLLMGLGLVTILNSFGLNSGCAINPAKDIAP